MPKWPDNITIYIHTIQYYNVVLNVLIWSTTILRYAVVLKNSKLSCRKERLWPRPVLDLSGLNNVPRFAFCV